MEDATLTVTVNGRRFTATLEDNETAAAFAALLPMTLDMSELNGNEKYHYLMGPLPSDAQDVGYVEAGDLMLFGESCVVLFYEGFSTGYRYTRIGRLTDASGLAQAAGRGSAQVVFE